VVSSSRSTSINVHARYLRIPGFIGICNTTLSPYFLPNPGTAGQIDCLERLKLFGIMQ
jgi:hypothetical protein